MCLDDLSDLTGGLDDLSTPGAYWLNPCMPRDTEGFRIDPETVSATGFHLLSLLQLLLTGVRSNSCLSQGQRYDYVAPGGTGSEGGGGSEEAGDVDLDAEAAAILSDLDPRN